MRLSVHMMLLNAAGVVARALRSLLEAADEVCYVDFKMPRSSCPHCGFVANAATDLQGGSQPFPKPEDFTICVECSALLKFDQDMRLVMTTDGDLAELSAAQKKIIASFRENLRIVRAVTGRMVQ